MLISSEISTLGVLISGEYLLTVTPDPLRCKWELSFNLKQSAFRKMEQTYFGSFGLSLTGEIFLSHERSPVTSPLQSKSNNGNRKGLEQ